MTHLEFVALLRNPQAVKPDLIPVLKDMVERYPYFTQARMLYTKALQQAGSIYFEDELNKSAIYVQDRKWLYYFIYPEQNAEPKRKHVRAEKKSGTYFDMIDAFEKEGKDVNQSLKQLAQRLKEARMDIVSEHGKVEKTVNPAQKSPVEKSLDKRKTETDSATKPDESYADKVKTLIQEKKYVEALEILKELNLNNPKKSIYFADQIRFLEKIIANSKK
ncbi:hypothetical protein D0T49_01730 [Paludibacter sp. 221]|uniref:hypothetical protein n=1 Tax=Paludibacter sp. 221 TaxID=2302939 RepID=UPI0013CFB2C8|nr:hypothetical protein [Paludibacter sp. 221]NDV45771.1 hypothetical protein [Paludibacter sp. 221]